MKRETRVFNTELRVIDDNGSEKIEGHAAVFNQLSEDLGGFREMIAPGAFSDVLENDVRCLFNHDSNYVIGRTASGTLELREDDLGLVYRADPPSTVWATDLKVTISRGDVNQSSFGFYVGDDEWKKVDGGDVRIINRVAELFDVSPVTFPAYPQTDVQVRALERLGVDPEALSEALQRIQRGEELSSSDRDLIDATAKKLSEAITPEEPEVSSIGISLLKKRVELAARK